MPLTPSHAILPFQAHTQFIPLVAPSFTHKEEPLHLEEYAYPVPSQGSTPLCSLQEKEDCLSPHDSTSSHLQDNSPSESTSVHISISSSNPDDASPSDCASLDHSSHVPDIKACPSPQHSSPQLSPRDIPTPEGSSLTAPSAQKVSSNHLGTNISFSHITSPRLTSPQISPLYLETPQPDAFLPRSVAATPIEGPQACPAN
ncbi:hypothetical protein Pmani_012445 [Petrolisthes manimaculis]|uniref:Uncharacterized protein n=1 Tax=Petrolisthes manimaculis TaxID=1843537 RepID=A0AAE1PX15_9EUCA|nr:hypothetical protein Pmani_012445 [Petrolisthes manimaculis]